MLYVLTKLQELFCRLRLYFLGVRFCEREHTNETLVHESTFFIQGEYEITFKCYRNTLVDLLFVRGQVESLPYQNYFVEANFSDNAPLAFRTMSKRTIYFNGGTNKFGPNEEQTLVLLMEIYLDFLKYYLMKFWDIKGDAVSNETRSGK